MPLGFFFQEINVFFQNHYFFVSAVRKRFYFLQHAFWNILMTNLLSKKITLYCRLICFV